MRARKHAAPLIEFCVRALSRVLSGFLSFLFVTSSDARELISVKRAPGHPAKSPRAALKFYWNPEAAPVQKGPARIIIIIVGVVVINNDNCYSEASA